MGMGAATIVATAELAPTMAGIAAVVLGGPVLLRLWLPRATVTIAGITFRETAKQPTTWIVAVVAALLILILPVMSMFALGQEAAMLKEMGLNTITLATVLVALLGAANVVTREIESKTLLTLLAKPVTRAQLVVGKYLGLMGVLLLMGIGLGVCLQVADVSYHAYATPRGSDLWQRIMWEYKQAAAQGAPTAPGGAPDLPVDAGMEMSGAGGGEGADLPTADGAKNADDTFSRIGYGVRIVVGTEGPGIVLGTYLVLWETAVLAAILVAGSTVFPVAANAVLAVVMFVVGHLMDLIENALQGVPALQAVVSILIPNLRDFEIAETFSRELPLPLDMAWLGTVEGLTISVVALTLGCIALERRDIG